jgi:hypothetical protein
MRFFHFVNAYRIRRMKRKEGANEKGRGFAKIMKNLIYPPERALMELGTICLLFSRGTCYACVPQK